LDFAFGLYVSGKAGAVQAAHIASISQTQFLKELGKREIPIHYEVEDFDKELSTLRKQNLL
jgi:predicted HTH domain antitoxin